ncbi:MAG: DnaJ domain-containing protein [Luteimonas sp.]
MTGRTRGTRWYGKLLGFFAGVALMRANPLFGALVGVLIGHAFDADWFKSSNDDPYRVFGLTEEASDADIDLAYRRLITQYHPDKLSGVAEDLRKQAEAKARTINAAHDRIQVLRRNKR